jgi:hypothetical protein
MALQAQRQIQSSRQLAAPRYIPSHDFDTQNIKLDLRFDWEREQALGTETITLAPLLTNLRLLEFANSGFNLAVQRQHGKKCLIHTGALARC